MTAARRADPRRRRLLVAAIAALALLAAAPRPALADGDPASDVLLLQDDYVPYQPQLSAPLQSGLAHVLKEARSAGYPIKVAVIASPQDLGAVPNLFAQPQQYATFLAQEIAFNSRTPLIVVMPQGYGLTNAGGGAASALRGLGAPGTSGADALGRSAIEAVLRVARAGGHPVAAPKLSGGGSSSASSPLLIFGIPVILLGLVGLLTTLRRRGSHEPVESQPPA